MRYELFIGLRYLRAKRRERFISLITWIATIGVAIGVMALNIVLAILTGFEEDLRDRILGFTPHVLVQSENGPIADYAALVDRIRAVPDVVRAEPLVYGQLMLSTAGSAAGVALRGVVPEAGSVPELERHMIEGSVGALGQRYAVPLSNGLGETVELPGIILGAELAHQLHVELGEPIDVVSPIGPSARLRAAPTIRRFAL
ncbi:MAG TPA: ABC transporter permease, partial [Candidatus Binatia bacterium]|nr:ABC transporter permease [Candidatus Binatia bacterium]